MKNVTVIVTASNVTVIVIGQFELVTVIVKKLSHRNKLHCNVTDNRSAYKVTIFLLVTQKSRN